MLYAYPLTGASPLDAEMIYHRTLLAGIESLKSGVTSILDDVMEVAAPGPGATGQRVPCLRRGRMRANVSGHVINRPFFETIPYLEESLPERLKEKFLRVPPTELVNTRFLPGCHRPLPRHRWRPAALRGGAVWPQRCTGGAPRTVADFSRSTGVPFHIHILETRVQRVTGSRLYGKSLIKLMSDLDALDERTSIAHAIWIDEEDIDIIAASGASVAHNPVCNLRSVPVSRHLRAMLDAGVNVALGTDGISSNDKRQALRRDEGRGPRAHACNRLITTAGPPRRRSFGRDARWCAGGRSRGSDRSIEVGKKADIVALDLCTPAFVPVNDLRNQLVYAENGSSVQLVMVGGDVVVEDGRCTKIDETRSCAKHGRFSALTSSSTRS